MCKMSIHTMNTQTATIHMASTADLRHDSARQPTFCLGIRISTNVQNTFSIFRNLPLNSEIGSNIHRQFVRLNTKWVNMVKQWRFVQSQSLIMSSRMFAQYKRVHLEERYGIENTVAAVTAWLTTVFEEWLYYFSTIWACYKVKHYTILVE